MTILMEKKAVHQAAAGDVFGAVLFWIVFSHIVFLGGIRSGIELCQFLIYF